jgi:hypothetical protein
MIMLSRLKEIRKIFISEYKTWVIPQSQKVFFLNKIIVMDEKYQEK